MWSAMNYLSRGWVATSEATAQALNVFVHPELREKPSGAHLLERSPPQDQFPTASPISTAEGSLDTSSSPLGKNLSSKPPSQHLQRALVRRRARGVVVGILSYLLADTVFAILAKVSDITNEENVKAHSMSIYTGAAMLVLLVYVRYTRNIQLASRLFVAILTTGLLLWVWYGGWYYGLVGWGPIIPIAAIWFLGPYAGLLTFLLVHGSVLFVYLGELSGYLVYNVQVPIPIGHHSITELVAASLFTSAIATLLSVTSVLEINEHQELIVRESNAKLAALYVKEDFLARMSHDLRTPLHTIRASVKLLEEESALPEQTEGTGDKFSPRDMLSLIDRSSAQLLAIMTDLLDFSEYALPSKQVQLHVEPVDPKSVLVEAVQMALMGSSSQGVVAVTEYKTARLRPVTDLSFATRLPTGVECVVTFSPQIPSTINCDPIRLKQVVCNLVGNACKFTKGGRITVDVDVQVRGKSTPQSRSARNRRSSGQHTTALHIRVADTGIGIDTEKLQTIFAPFYQVEETMYSSPESSLQSPGVGLGLSIVKHFVSAMGGDIQVASALGDGTEFTVVIPIETGTATGKPPLARASSSQSEWNTPSEDDSEPERARSRSRSRSRSRARARARKSPEQPRKAATAVNDGVRGRRMVTRRMAREQSRTVADKGMSDSNAPLRVLLAEDNVVNQKLSRALIKRVNPRLVVDCASDGQQFLDALEDSYRQGNPYAIAFVDIRMPVRDGISAVQEIRLQEHQTGRTPLVCIALTASLNLRSVCQQAGFDAFLPKPLNMGTLRKVVENNLPS